MTEERRLFDLLLAHVRTDGSFSIPLNQAKTLGIDPDVLSKPPAGVSDIAWSTAIVLAMLESKLTSLRGEWTLVAEKAAAWLLSALPAEISPTRCVHDAKVALKL
jgi:hypothetical protein